MKNENKKVAKYTLPVLVTYLFLGIGFGVLLKKAGYNSLWTAISSLTIYSGTMQYVLIDFLGDATPYFTIFFITLVVNARYAFYGLTFVNKYKGYPWYVKLYLMFTLTDETYSILALTALPLDENTKSYELKVSLFNHLYWIGGTIIGNVLGELPIDFSGMEFTMTALFLTIVIDQLRSAKKRIVFLISIVSAIVCYLIFKADFILPSLLISIALILALKKPIEREACL